MDISAEGGGNKIEESSRSIKGRLEWRGIGTVRDYQLSSEINFCDSMQACEVREFESTSSACGYIMREAASSCEQFQYLHMWS